MEQSSANDKHATTTNRFSPLVYAGVIAATVVFGLWLGVRGARPLERTAERAVNLRDYPLPSPPLVIEAEEAILAEQTPVIGVLAGDCPRAYAITAFDGVENHVINDVICGVPITLTHCPGSRCTRVFTSSETNDSLPVAVGGWFGTPGEDPSVDSVMILRVGEDHYLQNNGESVGGGEEFPYPVAEFDETTWGEWRRAHPDTDVVVMRTAKLRETRK
jgi:hypothetical protein